MTDAQRKYRIAVDSVMEREPDLAGVFHVRELKTA